MCQKALQSASLREIKRDVKALLVTPYKGGGFKPIRLLFTDECCIDRVLINEICEELIAEGHEFSVADHVPAASKGPLLELPPDVEVGCVKASRDSRVLQAAVNKIREQAEANNYMLGLDIEWEISAAGAPVNPPATVQLAAGNQVVTFHVLHGQRSVPEKLPSPLVDLLEDAKLTKVGVGIKGDCTKLFKIYDVEVRGVVDLPSLALEGKVELGPRRGLANLCLHFLGRCLPKELLVEVCTSPVV